MGGYGSGRWHSHSTRSKAGSCLFITPKILRYGYGNTLSWSCNGQPSGWINYRRTDTGVLLEYNVNDVPVKEPIRMERGRVGFMEGEWFLCPLLKRNGTPCERRCRKLYCPPGGKYFGCRVCYNLTYQSSNESHEFDRGFLASSMARELGTSPRVVGSLLKEMQRAGKRRRSS